MIYLYKGLPRLASVREKVGTRPYEVVQVGNAYTIKFYPMKDGAKDPDRLLFSLTVTKKEFESLAAKIK